MPIGKHISEPIRDSSLSHVHSWRARNSPSASSSYEFSNADIPNGVERKADSVASHYPQIDRKGTSVSPLNTVPEYLNPSNMAINSNNDSIFPSTIKTPILGTAKIDPFITMNYPEAMTVNKESLASRGRPQTPLRNGYITDKLYISKGFM
jgi:hypothetical protein